MRFLHSRTTRSVTIGATILGLTTPSVLGWGAAGHEIVATIAQIYTQPAALHKLCQIVNYYDEDANFGTDDVMTTSTTAGANIVERWPCHLASIATWADRFKYRMRWSAPLHYVNAIGDHPSDTCLFPGTEGWAGQPDINVLGGIHNTSSILISYAEGDHANIQLAQEALKFIVHFMGDLHMPLHLIGRDKGGNGVDVCWEGRRTNLHSAWDGLIVAKAVRTIGYNYTKPLPAGFEQVERHLRGAIYDPVIRRIIWEGVEGKWAEEFKEWPSCPKGEGEHVEEGAEVEKVDGVWTTLRDFFLPGWFVRRGGGVQVPVTDTEFICPYHWAKPIHALNCELIWPKGVDNYTSSRTGAASSPRRPMCKRYPHHDFETFQDAQEDDVEPDNGAEPPYELDNPEYMGAIEERMLLEQFLGQGGVRLAATLNRIFGEGSSVTRLY